MDIWNNIQGAIAGDLGKYAHFDEAFQDLFNKGQIITRPSQVAQVYGFDNSKLEKIHLEIMSRLKAFVMNFDYLYGFVNNIRQGLNHDDMRGAYDRAQNGYPIQLSTVTLEEST